MLLLFLLGSECLRSPSDSSRMEFLCEADACLVEPEAIEAINGNSAQLGWTAGNHSDFWGRKLEDGLVYRLGTLEPEKFVRKMEDLFASVTHAGVSLSLMDVFCRCWPCIPSNKSTNGILYPRVSTGGSSGATPCKTYATKDGMNSVMLINHSQSAVLHAMCYGNNQVWGVLGIFHVGRCC